MSGVAIDPWGRLVVPGSMLLGAGGPIVPPMPAARRSSRWPAVLAEFLRANRLCEGCGRRAETGHHVVPFHARPELELEPSNLAAVCVPCHFVVAHCGDWRLTVPTARADLAAHLVRVRAAQRA